MPAPRRLAPVLALAAALVLGGCGGDDQQASSDPAVPTATVALPTPTPSPTGPKPDCATILPRAAADALAGKRLKAPVPDETSPLPACRWTAADGTGVAAISVPASQWAQAVPAAVQAALDSAPEFDGREKLVEALNLISSGGTLDNAAACGVFSTIASAVQGHPAGTTTVLDYVPDRAGAQGISVQACTNGRYLSVQLASPTFKAGAGVEKRVRDALAAMG